MDKDFEKALEKALEGWVDRSGEIKEEDNREELVKYVAGLRSTLKQLDKMLDKVQKGEDWQTQIKNYVAQSEAFFLRGKRLVNYPEKGTLDLYGEENLRIFGEWADKRYRVERKGDDYFIVLPPMVSQYKKDRRLQEGRAIHCLTLYLLNEYVRKNSIDVFDRAEITFHHFIDVNAPETSCPDADNIDIKKVIDTMQGLIIKTDNILHLNLSHKAYLSDWAHTEIVVKRLEKIQQKN